VTAPPRVDLRAALDGWEPPATESSRTVDPWPASAFAELLDAEPPHLGAGDPLPPLWHWFTLLEHPSSSALGPDGHPQDGPLLPPIPHRRRLFAGGRLDLTTPLRIGDRVTGRDSVAGVEVKTGRSGEMAFVTVRRELSVAGEQIGVEEQDLVYRCDPDGPGEHRIGRPVDEGHELAGAWTRSLATDPVLLSRFSALTYNGHRIHYDTPYATGVEGYPDLVVHGPLLVLLALELPRRHAATATVRSLSYRLTRPAFCPATLLAAGEPSEAGAELAVGARGVAPSLTATVRFQ
jgi:3-methylfumaryl-CoA hydratase